MSTLPELVKKLRAASDAYYNTGKSLMTDNEYDELRDELIQRSPSHPFLKEVGAAVGSGAIALPYIMASLNKIKPGTGAVESFKVKSTGKIWVLSEKLDGISALWHEGRLYLRGNGQMGVEITKFAPHIQGLKVCEHPVRGELVVTRAEPCVAGTLARSWVNGQLHQKEPQPEIKVVRFVAYEIIGEGTPSEQFRALREAGFEVPWNITIAEAHINDNDLGTFLKLRREKSVYDTDGIVVADNVASVTPNTVKNPTTKMAFKMVIADQCAETTIVEVEWNASAQGYLIPRLQIEPVVVGSARIEFVTAHNAKFVVENKLAPGARIVIRRSGDVIPAVDRVITGGAAGKMPVGIEGTAWKWDANATHLVQIVATGNTVSTEALKAQLVHFAKTMEIVGMGPGVAAKLVDAGVDSVRKLFGTKSTDLVRILGKTLGPKIESELERCSTHTSELQLMVASSRMPRLIGDTKLKILFDLKGDPRQWNTLPVPQGWSADKLAELIQALPTYEAWRHSETPHIPYPIVATAAAASAAAAPVVPAKGTVCFTGVRSKELEAELETAGWKVVDSVSSKLSVLIIADGDAGLTGKAKKARDLGIRILEIFIRQKGTRATLEMADVLGSIGIVVKNIFSVFTGLGGYFPPGTLMVLLALLVVAVIVGISMWVSKQPTKESTLSTQLALYQAPYDSLSLGRKGVDEYLAVPDVQASQDNWVLLNFAPLTLMNAGYSGPYMNGVYDVQAIRQALDLGFRTFKFHIDFYSGSDKPNFGATAGAPCLLHRDTSGVIRSLNAGNLAEMITALDQQAFSPSLPTGKDPLIVTLDFKNTPNPVENPALYKSFLSTVSNQIQPLRRTLLTQLGESYFNNLQNQNLLFTQNFQSLRGKTLIFTNVDTTSFTAATTEPSMPDNLRQMIHAQIFMMDGSSGLNLGVPDTVTQAVPNGTQMAIGKQIPDYFLLTPDQQIEQMKLKTNNTFALVDPGSQNCSDADEFKLRTTYGVQIIPFFIYNTPAETLSMFKAWGAYSWKLKPPPLQYVVVKTVPPAKLSQAANAQGGNVSPPSLHL